MATLLPENIVYSGPVTTTDTQIYRSLGHFVLDKLNSFQDKLMLINAVTGQEFSARNIYNDIVRASYVLEHLGIKKGDVVCVSSENRYEFVITLFATMAINAIFSPINVTYTEREYHHAINLSKPKIIFGSKQTMDRIAKVSTENSYLIKHLICYDSVNSNSNIYNFDDLMKSPEMISKPYYFSKVADIDNDVALIVYSSGTTGLPKGVQLTQSNLMFAMDSSQVELTSLSLKDLKVLAVIPWFHVFGCLTLMTAAVMGTLFVYLPKFEETIFLKSIERYRISMVFMVPPLMVFLAKNPLVEKYDLSSLQILFCGAAPLNKETENQIKKRIGLPVIRQGYGLSETTRGVIVQNDIYCKPGRVGGLKKGLYAKVVDTETGKTLGPNQRGELCFKGGYIMKGYIGDSKSTQSVIKDGWLHTGDIGYFDEDFEFFIVDRIKELIKYKGFQVPPAEIEALLLTNTKIKDAAVIGKPDEAAGELPLAFIVKQENVSLTEDEVIKFIAERASPAKRLRGGVVFVDEIPKNPSGKILRRLLRDTLKKPKSKL